MLRGFMNWGAKVRANVIRALLGGALLTVNLFSTNINIRIFDAWVIQDLILKLPERSVLVMNNADFHKGKDMIHALQDAGHILVYLPA